MKAGSSTGLFFIAETMTVLNTERLRLEPFDDHHFDGLQAMNRLPEDQRVVLMLVCVDELLPVSWTAS